MAQTTPPTVDALPAAPNTSSPLTFSGLADAFLAALLTFRTQLVALGTNVYNNAVDCYNNAVAALNSANAAAGSATAAASSAGAVVWVSGATVAQGATVLSPADLYRPYRRTTATGSGATDPKNDSTNYTATIVGTFPYLHVRNEQASGTAPSNSVAATQNDLVLNTVVGTNSITGASLASNILTLPAGTYDFIASGPFGQATAASLSRLTLYNSTDSADIMLGSGVLAGVGAAGATPANAFASCSGRFTLASSKGVKLRQYTSTVTALGTVVSSGQTEVYGSLQVWKVA